MLVTLGLWKLRLRSKGSRLAWATLSKIHKTKQAKSTNKTNSLESLKLAQNKTCEAAH